ncbi:cysteine--tRNA ligase [Candidatus Kaiserbacteria bacterium RIFCSPHIGHO2_01_FULL_48_10]|uniref:Cysteine--tRNA ligase n=1 Tax=Candidatus Kaiserbacteria bacterium RIFCSPHIGHO2_01_FULL_48_10 TaxID=1798476 RepID=A0A1F6C1T0_9BACT|nr:MAG: cysteine--tRNA ligase [Candidatus Kaiserbacteria bacterium RIFCSPHIGHO2_01_FULL_48_10]
MLGLFAQKPSETKKILFYNTLSKVKEPFVAATRAVKIYTCGPTVYDYAHIGNLRAYVFADVLRRTLEYAGYEVKQIINITDVGHLVGDGDEGEDKMTAGLKREGMEPTLENMKLLAEKYAAAFMADLKELNVKTPFAFPRASEHIPEQIAFVATLMDKGYAYRTSEGIYFDVAKFPKYGILGGSASAEHSRIGVSSEKRDPRDFTLWKLDAHAGWDAPWGRGFPGWHIECTAMATKYLGKSFDIHTGGVDHIPVHHNNEIAQAEAVSGKPFVRYWMHGEFLTVDGQKISKSLGNIITLKQLKDRGISGAALRYWLLTAHYRQTVNFTWSAIEGAEKALYRLMRAFSDFKTEGKVSAAYRERFTDALYDDVNTAEAVALMWDLLKDDSVSPADKRSTLSDFDRILGLGLNTMGRGVVERVAVVSIGDLPSAVETLMEEREVARTNGDWAHADELRSQIAAAGFTVEDTAEGPVVRKSGGPL